LLLRFRRYGGFVFDEQKLKTLYDTVTYKIAVSKAKNAEMFSDR